MVFRLKDCNYNSNICGIFGNVIMPRAHGRYMYSKHQRLSKTPIYQVSIYHEPRSTFSIPECLAHSLKVDQTLRPLITSQL